MRHLITFVLAGFGALHAMQTSALACTGQVPVMHRVGAFHFQTNVRAIELAANSEAGIQRGQWVSTIACVRNLNREDVWVDWFIPALRSWVPAGDYSEISNFLPNTKIETLASGPSCIEYGNVGDRTSTILLGTPSEIRRGGLEVASSCRQIRRVSTVTSSELEEIVVPEILPGPTTAAPLRLFFPYDAQKPRDTLMRLAGNLVFRAEISAARQNNEPAVYRITSGFRYELSPVRDSAPPIGRPLRVRPPEIRQSNIATASLAFRRAYREGFAVLSEHGEITFTAFVREGSTGTVGLLPLEIIDISGERVASTIFVPFFSVRAH